MPSHISIPKLPDNQYIFPDPNKAPSSGLLAWGGDLEPQRLLQAYSLGIFPWFSHNDPILWWSPNPRLILEPKEFHISKSLKKSKKRFDLCVNKNFLEVISQCQKSRLNTNHGTWITDEMLLAYLALHKMGYAKSVECYENGELVGGLYGIVLGSVFCGESMFSTKTDASKVALWHLCDIMVDSGGFIDCQNPTDHLERLGAKRVDREVFLNRLALCKDNTWEFV